MNHQIIQICLTFIFLFSITYSATIPLKWRSTTITVQVYQNTSILSNVTFIDSSFALNLTDSIFTIYEQDGACYFIGNRKIDSISNGYIFGDQLTTCTSIYGCTKSNWSIVRFNPDSLIFSQLDSIHGSNPSIESAITVFKPVNYSIPPVSWNSECPSSISHHNTNRNPRNISIGDYSNIYISDLLGRSISSKQHKSGIRLIWSTTNNRINRHKSMIMIE